MNHVIKLTIQLTNYLLGVRRLPNTNFIVLIKVICVSQLAKLSPSPQLQNLRKHMYVQNDVLIIIVSIKIYDKLTYVSIYYTEICLDPISKLTVLSMLKSIVVREVLFSIKLQEPNIIFKGYRDFTRLFITEFPLIFLSAFQPLNKSDDV